MQSQNIINQSLQTQLICLNNLKPYQNNARTHSAKQIRQIAKSIETFGFNNPILIDGSNMIIAGHGRAEAARLLGMTKVPVICIDHLSKEQIRAFIIADNKIAENAGWDKDMLAIEYQELSALDISFDLDVTGFEMAEIDFFIDGEEDHALDPDDDLSELASDPVTQLGDLWQLGKHRLFCADALDEDNYGTLLGNQKAQIVFTDPPYNVPIEGHVCGLGEIQHREFAMASGEMSDEEFSRFLKTVSEQALGDEKGQRDGRAAIHEECGLPVA